MDMHPWRHIRLCPHGLPRVTMYTDAAGERISPNISVRLYYVVFSAENCCAGTAHSPPEPTAGMSNRETCIAHG